MGALGPLGTDFANFGTPASARDRGSLRALKAIPPDRGRGIVGVGVLPDAGAAGELAPRPGLAQLDDLVRIVRSAGLTLEVPREEEGATAARRRRCERVPRHPGSADERAQAHGHG